MKVNLSILFSFVFITSFSQTFTLQDTVFKKGAVYLPKIYFDFNKSFIREDAKPVLDSIGNFLVNRPKIKVEVSYHRDTRGSSYYSSDITQRRADSIRAYLVQNFELPYEQIIAKGYGESKPIISESQISKMKKEEQEKAHSVNRRVEITIIEIDK